jgi:5-hydroxyisourate hydrolase
VPGLYELEFHVGDYHRARGLVDGEAFLEEAPVRFRVADEDGDYHICLLLSLYGYSTYRGG